MITLAILWVVALFACWLIQTKAPISAGLKIIPIFLIVLCMTVWTLHAFGLAAGIHTPSIRG